jgi:two-component system, OmpR family, response regulator
MSFSDRLEGPAEAQRDTAVRASPSVPAPPPASRAAGAVGASRVRHTARVDGSAPSLHLHTGSRLLLRGGAPVRLTRREYDLLQFLCENPRRAFSRAQLLRQVWGYDMVGAERTVDVHVRRLRAKLGECSSVITTVRGVGYRLDDDAPVDIVVQKD